MTSLLRQQLNIVTKTSPDLTDSYIPKFYNPRIESDKSKLIKLIESNKNLIIHDEIRSQLEELIKCRNPKKKINQEDYKSYIDQHLGHTHIDDYGTWVYYPWSNKLVHLLSKEEFIEVRTNRNHYKITPNEERVLATKKIGIIGLSVGKAIAMTIATERICDELVLADFDVIELSNLNRIQTGVQNFGIKKTVVVAREIAELDPYLKVTCFHEGLTEKNIDLFFTKNGKINICIEVCDGLSTKIFARQKAKKLGIPVVMDTNDRGMIDIERFDLEPNRTIFHGLIEHLNIDDIKKAKTNEEKIPFILPIVGINKISTRLKASMMEVEESISTWPQLASEVVMGGGITTEVCRKIFLNEFHSSGRFYINTENIIKDHNSTEKVKSKNIDNYYHSGSPLTDKDMSISLDHLNKKNINQNRITLDTSKIKKLVEAGSSAPSGGNCQPWKWFYKDNVLGMFYDKSLNKSFLDYNHISAYLSLGSALQNIVLKAHENKIRIKVETYTNTSNPLVARFSFFDWSCDGNDLEPLKNVELSKEIYKRCTNRNIDTRKRIGSKIYNQLHQIASETPKIKLHICDDFEKIKILEDVIGASDRLRLMHPAGYHDLFVNELRLSEKENLEKMDGVDIRTVDLTFGEMTGINLAKDPEAISFLQEWDLGTGFEKISRKAVRASSSIGLITIPNYDKSNCMEAGRAIQNIWLKANSLNIGFQPLCVPVMFFARLTEGKGENLSQPMIEEIESIRHQFLDIFPCDEKNKEIFMFRLCIAKKPKIKSLRRPIDKILNFG